MGYLCDKCDKSLHPNTTGALVDDSGSNTCPRGGHHTWEGQVTV